MAGHKVPRLNEDIKREMSDILRGVKDPRVTGLVSVVRVDTTNDLSVCKVYLSVYGDEAAQQGARAGIDSAAGFIRRELGHRLSLRRVPELQFIIDDSIEHASRISSILKDLKNG